MNRKACFKNPLKTKIKLNAPLTIVLNIAVWITLNKNSYNKLDVINNSMKRKRLLNVLKESSIYDTTGSIPHSVDSILFLIRVAFATTLNFISNADAKACVWKIGNN